MENSALLWESYTASGLDHISLAMRCEVFDTSSLSYEAYKHTHIHAFTNLHEQLCMCLCTHPIIIHINDTNFIATYSYTGFKWKRLWLQVKVLQWNWLFFSTSNDGHCVELPFNVDVYTEVNNDLWDLLLIIYSTLQYIQNCLNRRYTLWEYMCSLSIMRLSMYDTV